MTYKMLIVDDEPIICQGLAATIPWDKYDVEVVGVAYDGEDAIQKIVANDGVDIVVSDVRMPIVDGLQLAGRLAERYKNTKMIIISGYDDFKYAQQAIQLGVKDYLLKPVDIDELIDVVGKLTGEIKQEQLELKKLQQSNLTNAIYQHVYHQQRVGPSDTAAWQNVSLYPFISMAKNYLDVTRWMDSEELHEFKTDWKRFIQHRLLHDEVLLVSIFISENQLFTCVVDNADTLTVEDITQSIQQLETDQFSFLLHDEKITFKKLDDVFHHLQATIEHLPIGNDGVFYAGELEDTEASDPDEGQEALVKAIVQYHPEKITEHIGQLFTYFQEKQFPIGRTVSVCRRIMEKVMDQLERLLQRESVKVDLEVDQALDVLFVDTFEQLQHIVERDIEKLTTKFNLREADNKDWLIARAIDYMETYYKEEMKAHEVADVINISPNYFSSLFKQKTGKNFNEYINHLRVEEAKKLLSETPYKVSEISEMVGYKEYKYFVEVFKKFTGVTPTKFRKFTV